MYDAILFPTDGREPADSALDYALRIASEHEATIHVLTVADTGHGGPPGRGGDTAEELEANGRALVQDAAARARDRGLAAVTAVRRGDPPAEIVDYSARSDAELLVMPTHGRRGVERFLLGSVTERVINTADVPVITVNPEESDAVTYPCQQLLVPTDGSRGAGHAVTEGAALAGETGGRLHLLYVVETDSLGPDARSVIRESELTERADEILTDAAETASALDAVERAVERGTPSREILSYIEANGIDLVVMGTHGTTDFSRYVLGGVSSKLVRTASVPVMWVRESPAED